MRIMKQGRDDHSRAICEITLNAKFFSSLSVIARKHYLQFKTIANFKQLVNKFN